MGSNPAAPTAGVGRRGLSHGVLLSYHLGNGDILGKLRNYRQMNSGLVTTIERVTSIVLSIFGIVLIAISLGAELLGLNLTPGFGMVQMFQLLVGLSCLTLAGYLRIHSLRPNDAPRSLQADIGIRLGATGLVFAFVSGLADLIGIGTHVQPGFERPFAGPLQLGGFLLGVIMIAVGMLLYFTSRGSRETSFLESLLPNGSS